MSGKEFEADGCKLYYDQSKLDWLCSYIFSYKPKSLKKEYEGICCSKGASYLGFWGLRWPFQTAVGRNFSMKLKSKNLTTSENSQRFQKGTMESEDRQLPGKQLPGPGKRNRKKGYHEELREPLINLRPLTKAFTELWMENILRSCAGDLAWHC